jgi:starch phosphorylase
MKAGMNAALNFSTLDGWWDEACFDADPSAPPIGFTIGSATMFLDDETQDAHDAESLYDVLEHEIVPRFYKRDDAGVPLAWMASVKQSMSTLAPTWDSLRMTREYTESYYIPGFTRVRQLRSGGAVLARNVARDIDRLETYWSEINVEIASVEPQERGFKVVVVVRLGTLDPADLRVQLWIDDGEEPPHTVEAKLFDRAGTDARYVASLDELTTGPELIVARVLPATRHTDGEAIPGLITWSS